MIRHLVSRALEAAGYEVIMPTPAFGAVELLADTRFDLVIANSVMPAASGAQVLEVVAQRLGR